MPIITAAIYARVSTDMQMENYSISTQIEACTEKAKSLGAVNIKNYVDDYTGTKLDRPALSMLREDIRTKTIDVVICYDPDRLARNLVHQLIITDEIEKFCSHKLVFVSVKFDNSPEGRLFYSMRGAFSEYERTKILERMTRGRIGKLKQGRLGNYSLYGYNHDPKTDMYIINNDEAAIVKRIYAMYLDGMRSVSIARQLNIENIPKFFQGRKLRWNSASILNILRNDTYIGVFHGNKKKWVNNQYVLNNKNEWIDIPIPQIISEKTFNEVSKLLLKNRSLSKKREKVITLLSGICYCNFCGNLIYVTSSRSGSRYYSCSKKAIPKEREKPTDIKCTKSRRMNTEQIDKLFWETLTNICQSVQNIKSYINSFQRKNKTSNEVYELKYIKKELLKLKNEQKTILKWFSSNMIETQIAEEKLKEIKIKIDTLTIKERELNISLLEKKRKTPEEVFNIFKAAKKVTLEEKRTLIRQIIDKVYIERLDSTSGRATKYIINSLC